MAVRKVSPDATKDSPPCLTNVKCQKFLGITLLIGGLSRKAAFFRPEEGAQAASRG